MTSKICTKCGKDKELTEFFTEKRSADGRRYSCKQCDKERKALYMFNMTVAQLERVKALKKPHRQHEREYARNARAINPMRFMIASAKDRARKIGVPFNLDKHVMELQRRLEPWTCELTGVQLIANGSRRNRARWNSASLDRIVPERGYVIDNVRIVAWAINCAMSDWGLDILLYLTRRINTESSIDGFRPIASRVTVSGDSLVTCAPMGGINRGAVPKSPGYQNIQYTHYRVVSPQGELFEVENMAAFCLGTRLKPHDMAAMARGGSKQKSCFGWTKAPDIIDPSTIESSYAI